jgi:hypothetical protein
MSKKKIVIKPTHELKKIDAVLDAWVNQPDNKITPPESEEKLTRITIELPVYLHRRIKKICAIEGVFIKEKIKQILSQNFPET